jgi:hypothetical protein
MSYAVIRNGFGEDGDCPEGMVDDHDGGCAAPVPPTGGMERGSYADPHYVPPTGGLYDYGVTGRQGTQAETAAAPSTAGALFLSALVLAPFLL